MQKNECCFSEETMDGKPEYEKSIAKTSKKGETYNGKFYDKRLHRFYLLHKFNDKGLKTITVILMNPSFADENGLDGTLNNVRKLLSEKYSNLYSAFEVLNVFPIRMPKSSELEQLMKKYDVDGKYDKKNKEIIKQHFDKTDNDILLAWGSDYHENAQWIIEILKNKQNKLFVYYLNDKGSPRHFSPRNFNKIVNEDKKLREVEIDSTGTKFREIVCS
jgi:hypothetical protein